MLTEFITDLRASVQKSNALSDQCKGPFRQSVRDDLTETIDLLNSQLELLLLVKELHQSIDFVGEGFSSGEYDRWERKISTLWRLQREIKVFSSIFSLRLAD